VQSIPDIHFLPYLLPLLLIFSHSLAVAFPLRAFENERLLRRLEDCVIEILR